MIRRAGINFYGFITVLDDHCVCIINYLRHLIIIVLELDTNFDMSVAKNN